MKTRYNKSLIMKYAWRLFKAQSERTEAKFNSFLKDSWHMAKTNPKGLVVSVKLPYDAMYNQYYNKILQYISFKIVGKGADVMVAEELTSETFVVAYRNYPKFDSTLSNSNTWLRNIANGRISDYFRANNKRIKNTTNIDNFVNDEGDEYFIMIADSQADTAIQSADLMNVIKRAFANLKPKYQRIADLYFIEQMEYTEIAEICNVPMGTVKGMISRCREMLQAELQGQAQQYSVAS
jgi:RNA polymerase sigma-70 factor (ECF subfamily)